MFVNMKSALTKIPERTEICIVRLLKPSASS